MSSLTPNFNLNKPGFTDPASIITAASDNYDVIDDVLGRIKGIINGMTPDQAAALPIDSGSAVGDGQKILNWYATMFKMITGQPNWFMPPYRSISRIIGPGGAYYVNVNTGSDSNDGLTSGTAFKTIQHALDQLPRHLAGDVTVNIADGDYTAENLITFAGFMGGGSLLVIGTAADNCKLPTLTLSGNSANIIIKNLRFCTYRTVSGNNTILFTIANVSVNIQNCKFALLQTTADIVVGALVSRGPFIEFYMCEFNGLDTAISATSGGMAWSYYNTGSGNNTALFAGSGIIILTGTQPSATTAQVTVGGGQIFS